MTNPENNEAVYDASTLGTPKMLILGVQHLFAMFGAIVLNLLGSVSISLSGLAVADLVGIFMNVVLPGKDYEFGANEAGDTAVNFGSRHD